MSQNLLRKLSNSKNWLMLDGLCLSWGLQHLENHAFGKCLLNHKMLKELKPEKEDNWNRPGIIYKISNSGTSADGMYGIFLGQPVPQTFSIKEKDFTIILRRKRTYLPFSIELIDFKKILHPGTDIPKSYSSDISLIENNIISYFIGITN